MEFSPHTLHLADGRRLAYATLGPSDGLPVVYLHGGIGTALTATPEFVEAVERHGVQWVALSRPGFGGSDLDPGASLRTVAGDVRALAAAHGWARIGVVGVSSGGPYALACAAEAPELVGGVALAASLSATCAPHRAPGLPLASRLFLAAVVGAPRLTGCLLGGAALLLRRFEQRVTRLAGAERAAGVQALSAAVAQGVHGLIADFLRATEPWELDLGAIHADVHLWHGLRDTLAPAEHCWALAARLPRCRVWIDPAETHFFFRRRSAEIAGHLVAAVRAERPLTLAAADAPR